MIFLKLFWTFFRIGAFTFGGGYAMLPLIQEAVLANNWAEPEALINFIAVSIVKCYYLFTFSSTI